MTNIPYKKIITNHIDIGQPQGLPLQKNDHAKQNRYRATGRSAGCPLPSAQNHSISNNIIEATGRSPLPIFGIAFLPVFFYDLK
jgi:hypothetical protein